MKLGLAVALLVCGSLLPTRGEEIPDFPTLSRDQIAVASLGSLLRSGKARFVTEDSSEEQRLRSALADRSRKHQLEAELFSMRNSLAEQFERRHGAVIRGSTVTLALDNGAPIGRGVLLDPSKGWVIAPLDIVDKQTRDIVLVFADGSERKSSHLVLSRAENLALFELGARSVEGVGDGKALPIASSARVGSMIAASGKLSRLVVGGISAIESSFHRWHSPTVRDQIDSHLESFSVSIDGMAPKSVRVFLCDLELEKEALGAPVFSLQGELIGIAMSRIDLPETVLIPAATLRKRLLESGRTVE